jgi:hypothetical protein
MRKALIAGAAVLVAALAGCSKKAEPAAVTPEMEAEQRQQEKDVRDAEQLRQKAEEKLQQTSTPADGELEERAERERRKREGK